MNGEPEKERSAQEIWDSVASERERDAIVLLRSDAAWAAPRWPYWLDRNAVMLNEAVALSLGVDPEQVHKLQHDLNGLKKKYGFASVLDYNERLAEATAAEFNRSQGRGVRLSEFVSWAKTIGWTLPFELDALLEAEQRQQVSADIPHSTTTPPEGAPLSNTIRNAISVGEELRAITCLLTVLTRSDQHGTSQTQTIAVLTTDEVKLPRGLSSRNLEKIFAAAKEGEETVKGVRSSTVCNAMRALYDHLRRGGKAPVSPENVRRLFAEAVLSIPAPLESLLAAEL